MAERLPMAVLSICLSSSRALALARHPLQERRLHRLQINCPRNPMVLRPSGRLEASRSGGGSGSGADKEDRIVSAAISEPVSFWGGVFAGFLALNLEQGANRHQFRLLACLPWHVITALAPHLLTVHHCRNCGQKPVPGWGPHQRCALVVTLASYPLQSRCVPGSSRQLRKRG